MSLADPIRQPGRFVTQVDALVRDAASRPGAADPFQAIDASLAASFENVVAGMMAPPEPPKAVTYEQRAADRQDAPANPHLDAVRLGMMSAALGGATETEHANPLAALLAVRPDGSPVKYGAQGHLPFMPLNALGPMVSYAVPPPSGIPSAALPPPDVAAVAPSHRVGAPMGPELEPLIGEMSSKYGVPDWLVRNVIRAESNGNPDATSPVGARGLMQLMPGTAAGLGVQDAYDPRQNVEGGVKYLRQLLDMFGNDHTKAVAAYNAGPGAVQRYGGVPPYSETQTYVKRVLG